MTYRREIDGLRAVAVLPVILFHAGFDAWSGGFVGVDVFFVISGFLITSLVAAEQAAGTFTLARFYERRARRILPALALVALVSWPFAWAWLIPGDLQEYAESLVAVAAFVSNVVFIRQSGYFATAAELKPLVHTWSLAVEEQFYLFFPPLFLLAARRGPRRLQGIVLATALASLAVAHWGALNRPAAAFFLLPTRAWELLVGALLALHERQRASDAPAPAAGLAQGASLSGLALIAFAIATFDRNTPVPGLPALLPTLGTALVLHFAREGTLAHRFLGSRPLVAVGLVSYSAYLWHQPIFALARLRTLERPDTTQLLLLALLSLALAAVTWRFVERPFRDGRTIGRRALVTGALLASGAMAGLGWAGHATRGFAHRFVLPPTLEATFVRQDGGCFNEAMVHARPDWRCAIGADTGAVRFILFGDSHARSLHPALDSAARALGLRGTYVTASACLPLLGVHVLRPDQAERNCHALNERVRAYARDAQVPLIVLVARWTAYTDGGYDGKNFAYVGESPDDRRSRARSRSTFEAGLERTLRAYAQLGIRVLVVAQVPQQRVDPKKVYYRASGLPASALAARIREMSVTVTEHDSLQRFVRGAFTRAQRAGLAFSSLALDSLFCDRTRCVFGDTVQSYYFDEDHLSVAGAQRAALSVLPRLARAAGAIPEAPAPRADTRTPAVRAPAPRADTLTPAVRAPAPPPTGTRRPPSSRTPRAGAP